MTARPLDFAPAAWQAYRGLPAGELAGQVKLALEWLAADPAAARADPRSRRHQILEERLSQAAPVWGLPVEAPNGGRWLVVWREVPNVIEIGYIGPAPLQAADDQAPVSGPRGNGTGSLGLAGNHSSPASRAAGSRTFQLTELTLGSRLRRPFQPDACAQDKSNDRPAGEITETARRDGDHESVHGNLTRLSRLSDQRWASVLCPAHCDL